MKYQKLALLSLIGTAALAACSKDQGSTLAVPTEIARSSSNNASSSCSYSTLRNDAKNYFANPKPVNEALQLMASQTTAAATTDKGFDVLTMVASAVSTPNAVIGSTTNGDKFVKDLLGCMSVGLLPAGFSVAGALDVNGLFQVVGGANDPAGSVTSRGTPTYGAEPQSGETWAGSAGSGRYLLYGYERDFSFTNEDPAATTAFELATVPQPITFNPAIVGGICETNQTFAQLQSVNVILPLHTLSFCGTASLERPSTSLFASIVRGASSLFAPAPLFAGVGGTGSLLSGLSPKGAITYAPTQSQIAFFQAPYDAKRSARPQFNPPISVQVTTAKGTALNGAEVRLAVINNKGSYETFNATAISAGTGIATFNDFYIDKSGGYIVIASLYVNNVATATIQSKLFNISGQ